MDGTENMKMNKDWRYKSLSVLWSSCLQLNLYEEDPR